MIKAIYLTLMIFLSACGDMNNNPELVDRLRAFGVETDSVSYEPSTSASTRTVSLKFLLASNQTTTPTWTEATIANTTQLQLENLTLDPPVENEDLTILAINATADIPLAEQLEFANSDGTATVTYGLRVLQGSDEEWIRGQIKVYPAGSSPSYAAPVISITSPTTGESVPSGTINLEASLTESNDEDYRISWLVPDGSMENRRTLSAEWMEVPPGQKTVIVTARGLTSGNFTWEAIQVTVE